MISPRTPACPPSAGGAVCAHTPVAAPSETPDSKAPSAILRQSIVIIPLPNSCDRRVAVIKRSMNIAPAWCQGFGSHGGLSQRPQAARSVAYSPERRVLFTSAGRRPRLVYRICRTHLGHTPKRTCDPKSTLENKYLASVPKFVWALHRRRRTLGGGTLATGSRPSLSGPNVGPERSPPELRLGARHFPVASGVGRRLQFLNRDLTGTASAQRTRNPVLRREDGSPSRIMSDRTDVTARM